MECISPYSVHLVNSYSSFKIQCRHTPLEGFPDCPSSLQVQGNTPGSLRCLLCCCPALFTQFTQPSQCDVTMVLPPWAYLHPHTQPRGWLVSVLVEPNLMCYWSNAPWAVDVRYQGHAVNLGMPRPSLDCSFHVSIMLGSTAVLSLCNCLPVCSRYG